MCDPVIDKAALRGSGQTFGDIMQDIANLEQAFPTGYKRKTFESLYEAFLRNRNTSEDKIARQKQSIRNRHDEVRAVLSEQKDNMLNHLTDDELKTIIFSTTNSQAHELRVQDHTNTLVVTRDMGMRFDPVKDFMYVLLSALRKLPYTNNKVLYYGMSRSKINEKTYVVNGRRTWNFITFATPYWLQALRDAGRDGAFFVITGKFFAHDIKNISVDDKKESVLIEPYFHFRVLHHVKGTIDVYLIEGLAEEKHRPFKKIFKPRDKA